MTALSAFYCLRRGSGSRGLRVPPSPQLRARLVIPVHEIAGLSYRAFGAKEQAQV